MRRVVLIAAALMVLAGATGFAQADLNASIAQIPVLAETPERGVFIDLVRAIDETYDGGEINIDVVPFARSVTNVIRGEADFHIPSFVNPVIPESALPYSWVPEPVGYVTLVIYSNAENRLTREDIDAAFEAGGRFPYVIEVGAGIEPQFPFPTQGSNSIEQSMRKVDAGRIDAYLWPPEGDDIVRSLRLGNIHREVYGEFEDVILVPKTPRGREVSAILND
ncbi:MAG: hypothetical protein ACOCY8_02975, partial [Spirochaetota bacterium]